MDLSHLLNHLGESREEYQGAVSPPIFQTSSFAFKDTEAMRQALAHEMDQPFYTRGHNPTIAQLQEKIAALEGAESCLAFSSGSAAISAGVLSYVNQGDHIVCVEKPYSWTNKLLQNFLPRFGVSHSYVKGEELANFEAAIQPNTKLILLESPNSMTFELQDIAAVCAMAKQHGIPVAIDNSYCTPLNQQPIAMGVEMVFHSATKYLSGHSDLVAGVLCTTRERAEKVFASEYMTLGATLSAHDAWLILRGLRTLPLRMQRVAETTPKVVEFLEAHPLIEQVYYPFSPSSPQYALAQQQMKLPGGQFSILLKAPQIEAVDYFCDHLQSFLLACSWGSYESLIFPISTLYSSANYSGTSLPWNLIRFYIGLEEAEGLIRDLTQALEKLASWKP